MSVYANMDLDVAMKDDVDSLKKQIDYKGSRSLLGGPLKQPIATQDLEIRFWQGSKSHKGYSIPQELSGGREDAFSIPSTNLFQISIFTFRWYMLQEHSLLCEELPLLSSASGRKRLKNEKRQHTFAIIVPSTRDIYLPTNAMSFEAYTRSWIGVL